RYFGTSPGGVSIARRLSWSHPIVAAHFFIPVRLPFATSGYVICRPLRSFQIDKRMLFKYDGAFPAGISKARRLSSFHPFVVAHLSRLVRFPFAASGYAFCRSLRSFQIDVSKLSRYFGTSPARIITDRRASSFHPFVVAHLSRLVRSPC